MDRDPPDLSNSDQAQLDAIAESYAAAIRRGDAPAVDQYLAQCPDIACSVETREQLRSLLHAVAMIEGLKPPTEPATDEQASRQLAIDHLDEYKLVREIGRGGMGIVCEAIHQSLGRRVAIKILAGSLLGDTQNLARFRREARAAARLRHSNIVPVFGVGQSDNHHYYVMDYIDGKSLRQWISSLAGNLPAEPVTRDRAAATTADAGRMPSARADVESAPHAADRHAKPGDHSPETDARWAADIIATVCAALQYAHSQGVLHRDIKPANLLIDRAGVVWITDFGLAKLSEHQAMTATGDIVGTPQYMAPESFEGQFDVRSEVYTVGLTLYELLTLRPAIAGGNPGAVIRNATSGQITRPRSHCPTLPRDLETIVLKCLAHDPNLRYQTAGEVHTDLRRFLAGRPITARPSGIFGRAARWSRREPVVASLTFATFLLLLSLAVVSAIGYVRTSSALADASRAKRAAETLLGEKTTAMNAAEQQRQRAENNLQVALAAFDAIMQNITERGIDSEADYLGLVTDSTSPHVTPDDALLLQSLLRFFDQLGESNSEDLLPESALAARRAGEIYQRLGQLQNADRAYSQALERYRILVKRPAAETTTVIAQAKVQNELAVIAGLRGQLGRADQMFHQTVGLLSNTDGSLEPAAGQFQLARAHRLFASMRARAGMDGLGQRQSPPALSPPRRPALRILKHRLEQEWSAAETAIEMLGDLCERHPNELRYQVERARAYRDQAKVASAARRRRDSEIAIRESIDLFEQLLQNQPDSAAIRYELAVTLSSSEAFGMPTMVRARRAAELSRMLLADTPDMPRYQALRAHTLTNLARFQQRTGKSDLATRSLDEAIQIYESLADQAPDVSLYVARRAQVLEVKSDLQHRRGDTLDAIETLQQEIQRIESDNLRPNPSRVVRFQLQRLKQKLSRLKTAG